MATPRRARFEATPHGRASVTTLELFFDLVFVFALTQITDVMAKDVTPTSLLRGALILTVLWWCWIGWAWLTNVVRADEGIMRVGMFVAMGAMFVAAITIPEAFDDSPGGGLSGPVVFAVCYFVVRLTHIVLFYLLSGDDPGLRRQIVRFAVPMVFGTTVLLIASQTTGALQTWLWVVAIVGDYLGTKLSGSDWRLASAAHYTERFALIIIVALGESIVATGVGVSELPVSGPIIAASALALALSAALWWAYFDVTILITERALAAAEGVRQITLARDGYTYLHLPMIIGIIGMSLGLKKVLGYVGGDDGHTLADPLYGLPLAALYGGTALFLLGHAAFTHVVGGVLKVARLIVVAVLAALAPLAALLPAIASLGSLAAVVIAMLAFETWRHAEQRHAIRHADGH